MGKISDFYTTGKTTYTKTIDNVQHTFTVTKTLNELFSAPVEEFDNSICLSFCSNNERVNTARRYYNSNANNNFNVAWHDDPNEPLYSAYYKENITGEPVEFLGTALIWANNQVLPDDDMFSLKDLKDGRGNSIANTLFNNYRFLLDVNGHGLNDLYISWTKTKGQSADSYTSEGYVGNISPSVKIIKNLMTTSKEDMLVGSNCNVTPVLFIKFKDQIYITTSSALYPYLYCWYYDVNYRVNNFDKFSATINQTASTSRTWSGAFIDTNDTFYLDMLGNFDLPGQPTIFPFTSDTDYVVGYARYASGSDRRACQWLLNAELTLYNENMFGLKWVDRTEYDTPQDLYDKMKLPYMDEYADIDCERWVTGLDDIKKSDSKNVDMDYDKMPDVKPDKDEEDKLAPQPLNPYALAERFFNRYLLTAQEMKDLKDALDGETLQEINAIQYVVNLCIVPDGLDSYYNAVPASVIKFGKAEVNLPAKQVLGATSILSFGGTDILKKYNNFLDYEPYTKISVYIPFCGKVNLPTDKVMGKRIQILVAFDYLDGNCTAYIYVGDSLVTTATGNFYCSVPLSQDVSMSKDMAYMFSAMSWIGQGVGSVGVGLATQNPAIAIGGAISSTASFGNSLHDIMAKSDTNIVQGGGNLNAFNSPMQCCVYYERPDVEVPKLFGEINGFACHVSGQLKEFSGFTSCSDFHLDGIVCTKVEKEMLEELLKKGVILD